jgi:hypothetical protein
VIGQRGGASLCAFPAPDRHRWRRCDCDTTSNPPSRVTGCMLRQPRVDHSLACDETAGPARCLRYLRRLRRCARLEGGARRAGFALIREFRGGRALPALLARRACISNDDQPRAATDDRSSHDVKVADCLSQTGAASFFAPQRATHEAIAMAMPPALHWRSTRHDTCTRPAVVIPWTCLYLYPLPNTRCHAHGHSAAQRSAVHRSTRPYTAQFFCSLHCPCSAVCSRSI